MSTCLPAGSIVTTASAPVTAAAAEAERLHPASTAFASAVSERSNAATSWPAFARYAAMPPPILPKPIIAIFISSSSKSIRPEHGREHLPDPQCLAYEIGREHV